MPEMWRLNEVIYVLITNGRNGRNSDCWAIFSSKSAISCHEMMCLSGRIITESTVWDLALGLSELSLQCSFLNEFPILQCCSSNLHWTRITLIWRNNHCHTHSHCVVIPILIFSWSTHQSSPVWWFAPCMGITAENLLENVWCVYSQSSCSTVIACILNSSHNLVFKMDTQLFVNSCSHTNLSLSEMNVWIVGNTQS